MGNWILRLFQGGNFKKIAEKNLKKIVFLSKDAGLRLILQFSNQHSSINELPTRSYLKKVFWPNLIVGALF